jgi:hypothetical protein
MASILGRSVFASSMRLMLLLAPLSSMSTVPLAQGDGRAGHDLHLVLRELARDLDSDLLEHDRHRDQEDDEEHQADVHQRRDVDVALASTLAAG